MISKRPVNKPPYHGFIRSDLCFFDIETLPTYDPEVWRILESKLKPPGNMSKPETIAKWREEELPLLLEEAISKTGLDGNYGSVCCISWAFGDKPVQSVYGNDEAENLETFFRTTEQHHNEVRGGEHLTSLVISGHNIYDFDLKFLRKRGIINRIRLSSTLPWNEKKWSPRIQDSMTMWDPDQRTTLDRLCQLLGVRHGADEFNGSMVAEAWRAGRHEKVARYCEADVEAQRLCWSRITGIY